MINIISQIYIEQTKHPTTVKNINNYICNYACSKFSNIRNECFLASPRIRRIDIQMLCDQIPPTVDIKFLSCARSPNLHSPFGKMRTDLWWQEVLHIELGLKSLVYVLYEQVVDSDCICTRVEADIRRVRHKQDIRTHASHISKNS